MFFFGWQKENGEVPIYLSPRYLPRPRGDKICRDGADRVYVRSGRAV